MENLPATRRGVAVLSKVMRHREHAGMVRVEVVLVVRDPRRVRPHARHHGGTRRIAVRELAVSLVEDHAAFRQRIQVRRLRLRMPVAAQSSREVVRHEQEDVRLRRKGRMQSRAKPDSQNRKANATPQGGAKRSNDE